MFRSALVTRHTSLVTNFSVSAFRRQFRSLIIQHMRFITRQFLPFCIATILVGCAEAPVAYNSDNPGPILHYISTDPAEIFRNKVDHEAALEARGVEPPVGNASWHEYWTKLIAYYSGPESPLGTPLQFAGSNFTTGPRERSASRSREVGDSVLVKTEQVSAYIVTQRRARGLPPL